MAYTIIDNDLLENENLKIQEQSLLIALLSYYNKKKGYSYPSYKQLKKRSKIKHDMTLINTINSLENKGYITKEVKKGVGTKYYINTGNLQYPQKCSTLINAVSPPANMQEDLLQKCSTTSTKTITNISTTEFEEFYSIYPKAVNKEMTYKNYLKAVKEDSADIILQATNNYVSYISTNNTESKYIFKSTNFVGSHMEYKNYIDYNVIPIEDPYWNHLDG